MNKKQNTFLKELAKKQDDQFKSLKKQRNKGTPQKIGSYMGFDIVATVKTPTEVDVQNRLNQNKIIADRTLLISDEDWIRLSSMASKKKSKMVFSEENGKRYQIYNKIKGAFVMRDNYKAIREFSDLVGETLTRFEVKDDRIIQMDTSSGRRFYLHHDQDCCESVNVEDICGDIEDILNSPILKAQEVSDKETEKFSTYCFENKVKKADICKLKKGSKASRDDSETWTFYKLATIKGDITIRWYGTSNGYYSESVDFQEYF